MKKKIFFFTVSLFVIIFVIIIGCPQDIVDSGDSANPPAPSHDLLVKKGTTAIESYDFTYQERDTTSSAVTFTICNNTSSTINLDGSPTVSATGGDSSLFVITQPGDTELSVDETVDFTIAFKPSTVGSKSTTITIPYDSGKSRTFTLDGKGVVIYQSFESGAPSGHWAWGTGSTVGHSTDQAYVGSQSLKFYAGEGSCASGIGIEPGTGTWHINLNPDGNTTKISLWIYDTVGDNSFKIEFFDYTNHTTDATCSGLWTSDLAAPQASVQNQWTKIEIPCSELASDFDFTDINKIQIREWNAGNYYYDYIIAE